MGICFLQPTTEKFHLLKTLEVMHFTRFMDDKMGKLVRQNKGATFHLPVSGHEMIGAISALSLIPGTDWAFPYYRDRAFAIGLGCSLEDLLAAFLARDIPHHSGGRMMPEHFSQKNLRIPCQSSVVGSQFLQAVGVAKSAQLRGAQEVVYVSGGEGSTSQGDFHEALNFAALRKLAVVFICENNLYATNTHIRDRQSQTQIWKRAEGYNIPGIHVDGNDVEAVHFEAQKAVRLARQGQGPSLIECETYRYLEHCGIHEDHDLGYRTKEEVNSWRKKDPLEKARRWVSAAEQEKMIKNIEAVIDDAFRHAKASPFPARLFPVGVSA